MRGDLVRATLEQFMAVSPAQRFVRYKGDEPTYFIVPDVVFHSERYQKEIADAIKELR